MSSSPFDRLFQGELEAPSKTDVKIVIASSPYQDAIKLGVLLHYGSFLEKEGRDPEKWKMTGSYEPLENTIFLGLGCTDSQILDTINHEFMHHLISNLVGIYVSHGLDLLLVVTGRKKFREFAVMDDMEIF